MKFTVVNESLSKQSTNVLFGEKSNKSMLIQRNEKSTQILEAVREKAIITKDTSMKFYNEKEQLCLEPYASGVRIGAGLLQVRESM